MNIAHIPYKINILQLLHSFVAFVLSQKVHNFEQVDRCRSSEEIYAQEFNLIGATNVYAVMTV